MNNRELLLAGIDLLFALLVVFVIAFFAVRYDEHRGDVGLLSIEPLDAELDGNYQTLRFLGIYLTGDTLVFSEYKFGQWVATGPELQWDWREVVEHRLSENDLPIVIYEIEESSRLGDLLRQISRTGQPIGIATLPNPTHIE